MHNHTTNGHRRHHWTFSSALHILGAMGDFWSSDLNRAAVDLIDPQPGMTLLDVGAGLGPATIEAAQRIGPGGRVIAVDPSPTMRRILGLRRLWQPSRRLIDIRRGAAEDLPIATGSVDAALAVNAAHHFNDTELATAELARVLKPGGRLLLIDEDFTNPNHPYHHQGDTKEPDRDDAARIAELLTDAGLSVTHTDHHPVAGVTATVINATAPADHPGSQIKDHRHTGGPS